MDQELLKNIALTAIAVFFFLLSASLLYRWAVEEYWRSRERAFEKRKRRMAEERMRKIREKEAQEMQAEQELAAQGRELIAKVSGPSLRKAKAVFGELRANRVGLAKYSYICFKTLQYVADCCDGFPSPYQLADQDPDRRRTQLQVLSTASAGLEVLNASHNDIVFDASLITWKVNLEKVRYEICPSCPVVENPGKYTDACPVMMITSVDKQDGEEE
ncbi:hypothetical protein MYX77_01110 [Acidobacteriia bacterium AH_259_A11_L15]|nr:hypothetical protein [Acidobacteriia bacterium AH_259_A11_L15]